jgi:hypothetical protein
MYFLSELLSEQYELKFTLGRNPTSSAENILFVMISEARVATRREELLLGDPDRHLDALQFEVSRLPILG